MDVNQSNSDDAQRTRLADLLRDPVGYFAVARREAREHARSTVLAHLEGPAVART